IYMPRAYQSPCSGTHCGLQCAQIPNLASLNQSGHRYVLSDSQFGRKGPAVELMAALIADRVSSSLECNRVTLLETASILALPARKFLLFITPRDRFINAPNWSYCGLVNVNCKTNSVARATSLASS